MAEVGCWSDYMCFSPIWSSKTLIVKYKCTNSDLFSITWTDSVSKHSCILSSCLRPPAPSSLWIPSVTKCECYSVTLRLDKGAIFDTFQVPEDSVQKQTKKLDSSTALHQIRFILSQTCSLWFHTRDTKLFDLASIGAHDIFSVFAFDNLISFLVHILFIVYSFPLEANDPVKAETLKIIWWLDLGVKWFAHHSIPLMNTLCNM